MTPTQWEGNVGVKSVELLYFLEYLLLSCQALISQTKYVAMMTKERYTNPCEMKFMKSLTFQAIHEMNCPQDVFMKNS